MIEKKSMKKTSMISMTQTTEQLIHRPSCPPKLDRSISICKGNHDVTPRWTFPGMAHVIILHSGSKGRRMIASSRTVSPSETLSWKTGEGFHNWSQLQACLLSLGTSSLRPDCPLAAKLHQVRSLQIDCTLRPGRQAYWWTCDWINRLLTLLAGLSMMDLWLRSL